MVNFKQTVINLHKSFPEMDLDMLFKIMECVVEDGFPNTIPNTILNTPPYYTSANMGYSKEEK